MRFNIFCFCFFISLFLRAQDSDSLLQQYASYPNDTAKINLLYEKGFALRNSDLASAIKFSQECCQTALRVNNHYYLAKALNLSAVLKSQTGLNQEAAIDFKRALQLRIQTKDTLSQAIILNNLGNVYGSLGNNSLALNCYEKSFQTAKNINNTEWMQGALLGIASLQLKMKMYQSANGNFETLINWVSAENNYEILIECYKNLGICKLRLGDTAAAEAYQLQAFDICEMSEDEIGKADVFINLGEIYLEKKNFEECFVSLQKGLEIAGKNKYNEGLISAWKKLSEYYNAKQNFKKAYFYLNKHDSVLEQKETVLQNSSADLWETKNFDEEKQPSYFSSKNIFQILIIGALILILTIVLIWMGNEKKEQKE